jgi:glutamate racemase
LRQLGCEVWHRLMAVTSDCVIFRAALHDIRHNGAGWYATQSGHAKRMNDHSRKGRPIAVFDSGVGGLTVLKSLRERLPGEDLLYLGDTARLPYGTKSERSIQRYANQAAAHLDKRDIKMLVVACNTVSAVALPELERSLAPLPVIGVVEPGAQAAVEQRPGGRHLVLATEATVSLGAYGNAIRRLDDAAIVSELACELLVALAEEGWAEGAVAESIIQQYLQPFIAMEKTSGPQTIILGCTHFPILKQAIRAVVGDGVCIVDSADTTAAVVERHLTENALKRDAASGRLHLLATDGVRRFARVGGSFLGTDLSAKDIELVDL